MPREFLARVGAGWEAPPRPRLERWQPVGTKPSRAVRVAGWFWVAAAVLQLVSSALALDPLRAQLAAESPSTQDKVLLAVLGAGVLLSVLQLAFARHLAKRWARLTLVAVGLLGALHSVALFSTTPLFLGSAAVAVVAMALPLWRRS